MKFAEEELGIKTYDFPKMPGAAKAINDCQNEADVPMKCIGVPCDLHHAEKIVIVNHADCGAYGGSKQFKGDLEAEQKFHESELQKAKEKILEILSGKRNHPCLREIGGRGRVYGIFESEIIVFLSTAGRVENTRLFLSADEEFLDKNWKMG